MYLCLRPEPDSNPQCAHENCVWLQLSPAEPFHEEIAAWHSSNMKKKKKTDPTFVTSNWGRVPLMHIKHAFILVAYSAPNVLNFFLAPSSISWVFFLFTEFLHTALKVKLCFYITEKRGIIVLTLQTDTCTSNCLLSSRTIGSYAPNKSFGSGDLWFIESWIDVYSQPNCQT